MWVLPFFSPTEGVLPAVASFSPKGERLCLLHSPPYFRRGSSSPLKLRQFRPRADPAVNHWSLGLCRFHRPFTGCHSFPSFGRPRSLSLSRPWLPCSTYSPQPWRQSFRPTLPRRGLKGKPPLRIRVPPMPQLCLEVPTNHVRQNSIFFFFLSLADRVPVFWGPLSQIPTFLRARIVSLFSFSESNLTVDTPEVPHWSPLFGTKHFSVAVS